MKFISFFSKSLLQTSLSKGPWDCWRQRFLLGIFCKNWVFHGSKNVVMGFLSEGPSNYWTEGFLLKAFHGSFKMKVSTKCFVWGHSAQKSDGGFFSGSSSDSRIRRFLWKYFMKTWCHLKKPQHVVFGWYQLVSGWLRKVLGGLLF